MSDVTLLLGAGASIDAGIPDARGLTRRIAEDIGRRCAGQLTPLAINAAIGALVAYDTARGSSPYAGVDVERLFSAVKMLADRDDLELAPFVATWNAAAEFPSQYAAREVRGIPGELGGERGAVRMVDRSDGAERVSKSSDVFGALEVEMLDALRRVLYVSDESVDYLSSILNVDELPLRVATLNYDLSIETMAQRYQVVVDTGLDSWAGNLDWYWLLEDATIRLLKLHGSIDWRVVAESAKQGTLGGEYMRTVSEPGGSAFGSDGGDLGVIFGQREKVRSGGPFLAMLRAFDEFLSVTGTLVVVGYSFRDKHINDAITRWFNCALQPRVVLIDPGLVNWRRDRGALSPFLSDLLDAINDPRRAGNGSLVVAEPAATGLARVFGPNRRL